MAELARQFVCVRIQSMNGVNIARFPFEFDLTWMAFFQSGAGRTYARFGGREDADAESHLNKAALLRAMRQVLQWHEENAVQPVSRYEPAPDRVRTPEDIPTTSRMLARRKEKCIHCHDVKAASLRHAREEGRLRKEMVFTYPSPRGLGIALDSVVQQRVATVRPNSPATEAGIRAGDTIRAIDGQRVLTYADVTRVLELQPAQGSLSLTLERGEQAIDVRVPLADGWRKYGDPSWRATTGVLGPSVGVWGQRVPSEQRRELGLADDVLAVRVNFIWAPWARQAGIQNGDVIVGLDDYRKDMTIRQLHSYMHLTRDWGDQLVMTVLRGRQQLKLKYDFPDEPPNP